MGKTVSEVMNLINEKKNLIKDSYIDFPSGFLPSFGGKVNLYKLMEDELDKMTPEERQKIYDKINQQL